MSCRQGRAWRTKGFTPRRVILGHPCSRLPSPGWDMPAGLGRQMLGGKRRGLGRERALAWSLGCNFPAVAGRQGRDTHLSPVQASVLEQHQPRWWWAQAGEEHAATPLPLLRKNMDELLPLAPGVGVHPKPTSAGCPGAHIPGAARMGQQGGCRNLTIILFNLQPSAISEGDDISKPPCPPCCPFPFSTAPPLPSHPPRAHLCAWRAAGWHQQQPEGQKHQTTVNHPYGAEMPCPPKGTTHLSSLRTFP